MRETTEERPQGAHTVTSFTSIDDGGSISTSFPSKEDRTVMARSTGEVYTWARGLHVQEATGDDKLLRALRWAMTGEGRP